jgi:predicted RNA binding protein YcfA (HicA-like mRNA interferase family)
MPKLPSLRPREVIQALESVGFRVARQSGSHIQLKKGIYWLLFQIIPGI